MTYHFDTQAIHPDYGVTDDKTVAPTIHYSAVFGLIVLKRLSVYKNADLTRFAV